MSNPIQANLGQKYNDFLTNRKTFDAYSIGQDSVFTYANGNTDNELMRMGKEYTAIYDAKDNGGDGNGSISKDEFIKKGISDYKKMFPDKPLNEQEKVEMNDDYIKSFQVIDSDGDGGISSEEMTTVIAVQDALDSDGTRDGKINYSTSAYIGKKLNRFTDIFKAYKEKLFPPKKPE